MGSGKGEYRTTCEITHRMYALSVMADAVAAKLPIKKGVIAFVKSNMEKLAHRERHNEHMSLSIRCLTKTPCFGIGSVTDNFWIL
jgi:hypothetical protein